MNKRQSVKLEHIKETEHFMECTICGKGLHHDCVNPLWLYPKMVQDFLNDHIHAVPDVKSAIAAIEEKKKIKYPSSPEDYQRFCREMDAVDIRYEFITAHRHEDIKSLEKKV